MPIPRRRLFTLAAAPLIPRLAAAQPSPWRTLFDGATLNGWTIVDGNESLFYVDDGALCVSEFASFPAWLRSNGEFENFELEAEFFIRGWTDSGIYLHAPLHGRPTHSGIQVKIFHQVNNPPTPYSMGALFPLLAPSAINVRPGWNSIRVLCHWPSLTVETNGQPVQDVKLDSNPDLAYRLRRGFIGIAAASTPCRFRSIRIRELPSKQSWTPLYEAPPHLDANFQVSEGEPGFTTHGPVLRAAGLGHLATRARYRDFQFQMYARTSPQHNGGVIFRSSGRGNPKPTGYEIQLHNVEEAHYPTGSLYNIKRAIYPRIEDGKWFFFELDVRGPSVAVRVNGERILDYSALTNLDPGFIELQAHRRGYWAEYKHIRLLPL